MSSAAPLRVALAGYGLAGRVFHAPMIAATDGLDLAAVVTRDAGRAAQARAAHRGVEVVASVDEVLAGPRRCDVLVVAAPNGVHVPLSLAAVAAGVAVVVDKPLAVDADAAARVVAAAAAARVPLTVFQNRRWDFDYLTLNRLIDKDTLGHVHRFESRFERWRPEPKPGSWRERARADEGGGLLLDLGSHLVDQALQLWGPARRVYAEIEVRRPGVAADDDVFVALEHHSGVRSHLWAGALTGAPGPRFRVLGDRGSYVSQWLDPQEEQLRGGMLPTDPEYGVVARERWGSLHAGDHVVPVEPVSGDYAEFYRRLEAALRDGAELPVDPSEAVDALRVIDAARRSAADHVVVAL